MSPSVNSDPLFLGFPDFKCTSVGEVSESSCRSKQIRRKKTCGNLGKTQATVGCCLSNGVGEGPVSFAVPSGGLLLQMGNYGLLNSMTLGMMLYPSHDRGGTEGRARVPVLWSCDVCPRPVIVKGIVPLEVHTSALLGSLVSNGE